MGSLSTESGYEYDNPPLAYMYILGKLNFTKSTSFGLMDLYIVL
jgi:hypothetical protein